MLVGVDARPLPPTEAQRELDEAFNGELFYEFMPRAKRWAVKRKVPWEEVEKLVARGQLSERDIAEHLIERQRQGFFGAGDYMVVHAFTVQGPKGEFLEPGSFVVEALKKADVRRHPQGVRGALKETIEANERRKAQLDAWVTDQIEQAVEDFDPWLNQLPRMSYPINPLGEKHEQEPSRGSDG